jgi:RNA polymerase sigma-70 factor (ECF subfamily)
VDDQSSQAHPAATEPSQEVLDVLVANHREVLGYVERRVGNRAIAEEIVQEAFVRSLDRETRFGTPSWGGSYRVLRNAVIDHQRRQAVANRRLDEFAEELETTGDGGEELANVVCAGVGKLAGTLKLQYADALRGIEVEQVPVKDYAEAVGISASNAGVRVFRAREVLRKQVARSCGTCAEHGCLDCTCDTTAGKHRA